MMMTEGLLAKQLGDGDRQIGHGRLDQIGIGCKRTLDVIERREQRLEFIARFAREQHDAAALEAVIEQMHRACGARRHRC